MGNDKNQAGTANPDVPDYTTQSMSYPAEGLREKRVDDKNVDDKNVDDKHVDDKTEVCPCRQ